MPSFKERTFYYVFAQSATNSLSINSKQLNLFYVCNSISYDKKMREFILDVVSEGLGYTIHYNKELIVIPFVLDDKDYKILIEKDVPHKFWYYYFNRY